jgi:hypothetical protein
VNKWQQRRIGNTKICFKGNLKEQQEKNKVKLEEQKKGFTRRKRSNIVSSNWNWYKNVIEGMRARSFINKWIGYGRTSRLNRGTAGVQEVRSFEIKQIFWMEGRSISKICMV